MEFYEHKQSSFDRTVKSLCKRIDDLEEACLYWQHMYEEQLEMTNILNKERLLDAQKGVANALKFCLAVTDDKDGNLVISKKNRKELADNLK